MIVQALVDYARYIRSDSRFIVTWHNKIHITWKNWDLGQGRINIEVEQGDVLLVQGRENVIFFLVITATSSIAPKDKEKAFILPKMHQMGTNYNYYFFAQIVGADYGH